MKRLRNRHEDREIKKEAKERKKDIIKERRETRMKVRVREKTLFFRPSWGPEGHALNTV